MGASDWAAGLSDATTDAESGPLRILDVSALSANALRTMPKQRHTNLAALEDGSVLVTANRIAAGALLGSQIVWLSSVVPTERRLTPSEYVSVHSLLTWYGDAIMPSVGFVATVSGYLRYRRSGSLKALVGIAALTVAGISTFPGHRINIRIRGLRPNTDGPLAEREVQRDRDSWGRIHRIRTAGGLVAALALLSDAKREVTIGRPRKGSRLGWMDGIAGLAALVGAVEWAPHIVMVASNSDRRVAPQCETNQ